MVQQRQGVALPGGIDGGAGDPHEHHADRVADAVVAGRSAEGLLNSGGGASSAGPVVQRTPSTPMVTRPAATKKDEDPDANCALRVVAYDAKGKTLKMWEGDGFWREGKPMGKFEGTLVGSRWTFNEAVELDIAIGADRTPIGAWATKLHATRVVIQVAPLDDVVADSSVESGRIDEHPLGTETDAKKAGNGQGGYASKDKKKGSGESDGDAAPHSEKSKEQHDGSSTGQGKSGDARKSQEPPGEGDGDAGKKGTHSDGDTAAKHDDLNKGNNKGTGTGGQGFEGGSKVGRADKDSSVVGKGPGGEHAKRDGGDAGNGGAKDNDGSKDGDSDGVKHGSENGRFGGEGHEGDDGVRGAGGFIGWTSVPASLKGVVEIALAYDQSDITGNATTYFKESIENLVKKGAVNAPLAEAAATLRTVLASQSRHAAEHDVQKVIGQLKNEKAWKALTKDQQKQVERYLTWRKQREYFQKLKELASQERESAKAALETAKPAEKAALEARHSAAEIAEKAAKAEPVAGRLPINHQLAGELIPDKMLPKRYRGKGLRFKETGYPDFLPVAKELPNGQKVIKIEYQGSRKADFDLANALCKWDAPPVGYMWHHLEDGTSLMLVPQDLHDLVRHTGGVATAREAAGLMKYRNYENDGD